MLFAVTIPVLGLLCTTKAAQHLSKSSAVIVRDSFPQVSLLIDNKKFGVGVIIGSEFVLTTASLLLSKDEHKITIAPSGVNLTMVYGVKEIEYYYDRYDARMPNGGGTRSAYDVAIIHVNGDFNFAKSGLTYVRPIEQGNWPVSGQLCELLGFDNDRNSVMTFMSIVANKSCSESFKADGGLYPGEMCAIARDTRICKGDEGSPLLFEGNLVGIASWLRNCEEESGPAIFVDAGFFYDWMEATMEIMLGKRERWFHPTWEDYTVKRFLLRLFESGDDVCEMGPKREKIRGDHCYLGCQAYGKSFGLCANNECICPAEDGDRSLYDLVKGIVNYNHKNELCWQKPCRSHKPFFFF